MPGLRIQIDTSAAQRASAQLRSELSRLGSSAATNTQEFQRLEQRMINGMGTAGAQRSLESLQRSLNMTRLETARFRASLGDFGGAFRSLISLSGQAGSAFSQMFASFTLANIATQSIYALGNSIEKVFKDAFNVVEQVKVGAASLAATITTFSDKSGKSLAEVYKQAYDYSLLVGERMEEWNAQTIATGENLKAMVETMAQSRVLIDVNNQKQKEGFLAIANAIAITTQGQNAEIQFRQEIRGLMDGEARAVNRLATMVNNTLGGALKDNVAKWREQGTVIDNVGVLLSGFSAGTKDLERTWQAVGTTLETIYTRTLRGMFVPIYEDIIDLGMQITTNAMDQDSAMSGVGDLLKNVIYRGWIDIKNIVEIIGDTLSAFEVPLKFMGTLIGLALDGWGQILAAVEVVWSRVTSLVSAMWQLVEAAGNYGKMLYSAVTFRFDEMNQAWDDTKASWMESGKKTGEALSAGIFTELETNLVEYNKDLTVISANTAAKAPKMQMIENSEDTEKAAAKAAKIATSAAQKAANEQKRIAEQAAKEHLQIIEKFQDDYNKSILSSADYQQLQLDEDMRQYQQHVQDKSALDAWYSSESKKIEEQRLDDSEKALKDYFGEIDDLDKDLTDTAREEAEQRAQDLEDTLEDQRRAYEDFVSDVQSATSDIFMSLFDGGFSSFFDEMENMFQRTLSNMAAQAIAEPIIVPVIQSISSVLGSTISSSLGIAGSTATGTGFNISNISSIYSAISGGLETGVYNALTSGVLGNLGSSIFGTSWLGTGTEISAAAATATGAAGTSGIASAIASVAPWASMVALAVPLVMRLFEDDPEPFLRVQTTSTSQELSDPNYQWANGEGVSPAGFDYNLTLQDIDSSESREALYQAITAMLDAQFTAIEDTLNVSVNDAIVAAQNAGGGYGEGFFSKIDLAGYEDDLEGALSALSEDLFTDIRGFLVEQLAGEAGSVFNADFFDSIALADEGAIDTFLRFGSVVESTDDFMGQFTRQMEEYGETATQAFENVQTITTIMDALSTSAQDFSDNSSISTLEAINEAYVTLTETLEGANATIEDLAATEQYRLQELGAAVTGLTATSVGTMLTDSINNAEPATDFLLKLQEQIRAGVGQAVVNTFSETLYSALLAPINSSIGSMVSSIITGGVLTGEALQAGISGIVDQLDATAAVLNDPAIITAIQELMNSVTTITTMSGAEETGTTTTTDATNPIDAMNAYNSTSGFYDAVESASEEAATSIEDLTEEINSFNTAISDIIAENSMDEYGYNIYKIDQWYEEQKTTAEELSIALDDLNTAYDLQKKKIEEARQDAIDEFKDSVASVIAENTLNDYALSLRELNSWYDEQKAKADDLGVSLDDLNTAYDLQKSALDNDLISQYNELTKTFVSALNPLNDYQTQQAEIVSKYGEIADIFSEYGILIDANGNITDIAATGLAAMNAELDNLRASMIGTIQAIQATITGTSDEQTITSLAGNLGFDESYTSTLLTSFGQQAFLDAIAGMDASVIADYLDSVAADPETLESLVSMFLGLQSEAAEEAATRAQNIADFSSSIDDIIADNTLGDYANQLREIDLWYADQLVTANDLGVAMDNLNLAYELQIQAVEDARQAEIEALTSSFSDLIAESTLSDYEKSLRSLSQWYEEQYATVVALGMPLDLLNAAYDAQKEAIEATEAQRLADELAALAEEMAALQEKISDFNTAIDDTIAENTLSDLELSLRTINQWYAEQKAMAQELGIALDDLNYAYDLQIKATHTAAVDAARSAYQSAVSSAISDAQEKQTALESAYASAKSTYISVLQQELSAQAQVTAEIESTIETFSGFVESLQDARDSLARSESSGGSPDQIYAESSSQLDALMKDIWSGETDKMAAAMENLPGLGSDFLSASKSRTADYQEYLRDVAKVQLYLSTAQDIASSQKSTEELALEQSESQTNNLQSILDSLEDQLPSLADAQESYYVSQLELNNSQYQSQIDYYTAELERLDLLINGTTTVASALAEYQAALLAAISAGDSSYASELDAATTADTITGSTTTDTTTGTTDVTRRAIKIGESALGLQYQIYEGEKLVATTGFYKYATRQIEDRYNVDIPDYGASFSGGGTVSGSSDGYMIPTTFHGVEHITPDSQMQGVKNVLKEIKEVLEMMMNTGGENYKLAKKIHRIIDDSSNGKAAINTRVAA